MRWNRGLYQKLLDERSEVELRGEGGYPAPSGPGHPDDLRRLRRYVERGVRNRREAIDRSRLQSRYPAEHAALVAEQEDTGPALWSPDSSR